MKMAISTPVKRAPVNSPPKASGPRIRPTAIGARTAISPGRNISFKAALVEIETQEEYADHLLLPAVELRLFLHSVSLYETYRS